MYNILNGILVVIAGSCPGGHPYGVGKSKKLSFSEHSHVAYQIKGDDE